tara:strand:- start:4760 stop:5776 length:1017 start_codon:yes stop_codon:yes gene_type:complete
MKTYRLVLICLLFSTYLVGQTTGISYKAVVKDNSGVILANSNVVVQFDILASSSQALIYTETHNATTNGDGLLILTIGQGNTTDVFSDIDWGRFEHHLNVKIDTGSGIVDLGNTRFMAVPYALQSDNAKLADLAAIANRVTLKSTTTNQFSILYDSPGDKLRVTETGVTGNVMEIKDGELYLPQYAASNNGPLKVDATGKVVSEIIPVIQEVKFNRFQFVQTEEYLNYTKYYMGVQFEDGVIIDGIKAYLMDNIPGSNGVHDTAYAGLYRSDRFTNGASPQIIYRIDGSDTPTNQFVEFTDTSVVTSGSNVIDNTNFIYYFQIWICDSCLVQELSAQY